MERVPLLVAAVVLLGACTAQGPTRPSLTDRELLAGTPFGANVDPAPPIAAAQATGLDDDMRAFVAASIGSAVDPRVKLRRLLDAMRRDGLFALVYSGVETRTAQETFRERRGNCLSFTMMFVALAREAGLDVKYQLVDVPPTWSAETEVIVVRNHVNAVVKTGFDSSAVVDFNLFDAKTGYSRRDVSDDYVLGLFYSNVGAEALIDKEYELGFRHLRESARVAPRAVAAWVNLGALYSRQGASDYAEAAYLRALAIEPGNRSALNNLARLYTARGDTALAELYTQRVRRYQDANPYYHYSLARDAYVNGRLDEALDEIRRALRLKRDDHEFYLLQGRALLGANRADAAQDAFDRGRAYAEPSITRAEYDAQVLALAHPGDAHAEDTREQTANAGR
ncbi:MAG TPA: tetratricopeptide repeat protein [Gammaproteobacteria bacterium]|nr:tetratricopeptide repeat protein [Gammaproteobacteria bacterium]